MLATVDAAIGENLRTLREAAGLTQGEVAARMVVLGTDWTGANVSLLEHGKRKFSLSHLADLCEVLGVPVIAFLGIPSDSSERVARRIRALGGTADATATASPLVADDEDADAIARQRQANRVLDRMARAFMWADALAGDAEAQRDEIRLALEGRYPGGGDVLEIREAIAVRLAYPHSDPQSVADARGQATRKMIDTIGEPVHHRRSPRPGEGLVNPG